MLKWIIPLWKSHLLCWSHGVSFLLLHQPVVLQAGEWRAVIGWHMHTPTHILLHKGVVQANDAWTDEGMQRLWLHSLHLHISSSDSCFIVQFFSSWCFLFPAAVFFPLPPPSLPLLYAPPPTSLHPLTWWEIRAEDIMGFLTPSPLATGSFLCVIDRRRGLGALM